MKKIYNYFIKGFANVHDKRDSSIHRIGSELKFPLVNRTDGRAASFETVCALWDYLIERGWHPIKDSITGLIVGATKSGEFNDTVTSCETGFCKVEFSLAHVDNLFKLNDLFTGIREELCDFSEEHNVYFLGYGIQPISPPSYRLLMKKSRTSVWHKIFNSNRFIDKKDGDDIHLFTINAASHVHVSVLQDEIISAVNVLNGFAGAQIALTANSNIWRGHVDSQYKCVAEKFWDWWMPDDSRIGVPIRPFKNLEDYVHTVFAFPPVYVKRNEKPILLTRYNTFENYYYSDRAIGIDIDDQEFPLIPTQSDIDLHSTFYWYNTRISRYYTVENRVNDQQPPEDIISIAALTLGLISSLSEAWEEISSYEWENLRVARDVACRKALGGEVGNVSLYDLAGKMLDLAHLGLSKRGLGEEVFLHPLFSRLRERRCPADEAEELFIDGGIESLLKARTLNI